MYGQEMPNDDPAEENAVFPYSEEECKSICSNFFLSRIFNIVRRALTFRHPQKNLRLDICMIDIEMYLLLTDKQHIND